MSIGKLDDDQNFDLDPVERENSAQELISELNVKGLLNQSMRDIGGVNSSLLENSLEGKQQLQRLILRVLQLAIYDLSEIFRSRGLQLEFPDLVQLKERVLSKMNLSDKTKVVGGVSELDQEVYYIWQEAELITYRQNNGVKAIEKIALDAVAANLESSKASQKITAFQNSTKKKIMAILDFHQEDKDELKSRLDNLAKVTFPAYYHTFNQPGHFVSFLVTEMSRLADKSFNSEEDFLFHSAEIKLSILPILQKRYGAVFKKHSNWIYQQLKTEYSYSGSINELNLWDIIFEHWQSQIFKAFTKKYNSQKILIETRFADHADEINSTNSNRNKNDSALN